MFWTVKFQDGDTSAYLNVKYTKTSKGKTQKKMNKGLAETTKADTGSQGLTFQQMKRNIIVK